MKAIEVNILTVYSDAVMPVTLEIKLRVVNVFVYFLNFIKYGMESMIYSLKTYKITLSLQNSIYLRTVQMDLGHSGIQMDQIILIKGIYYCFL